VKNYVIDMPVLLRRLREGPPISFVRYGDGEFMCLLQEIHGRKARATNCDRHDYTLPLALDLLKTLKAPVEGLHYGMQKPKFLASLMGITEFEAVAFVDKLAPKVSWFHGDVLHQASIAGELAPFLKAFLARGPVLVGPPIFKKLDMRVKREVAAHIEIPALNCFEAKQAIKAAIWKSYKGGRRTFSVSASMAAKAIIHEMLPVMPDASLLDLGSLWDVFCGAPSRSYHKKMTKETYERNLAL
jgi:hypothetical protein